MTNNNTTTITPSDETTANQITQISPKKNIPGCPVEENFAHQQTGNKQFFKGWHKPLN